MGHDSRRQPAGVSSLILHLHRRSHSLFASARRRITALACLTLTLALALRAPPARAYMMHHHDLASLALMSDAIVLAQRDAERKIDAWRTATEHRVLKTYAGSIQPGDVVEIAYAGYGLAPIWAREDGGAPRVSDEVILFLVRATDRRGATPDGGAPPPWWLVASGLRIFVDGKAYRFEQSSNPGPYKPVPQGRDPFDVLGDPRGGDALTLTELEAEIARAIERARGVRAAIADARSESGKRRLLDAIGPPEGADDDAPAPVGHIGFWEDRVATSALEALAATGDQNALLEGVSRVSGGVSFSRLRDDLRAGKLFEIARSTAAPAHHRLAALKLLDGRWYELKDAEARSAAALFSDPDPRVRRAATSLSFRGPDPDKILMDALKKRWVVEKDPSVQYAILEQARSLEALHELDLTRVAQPIFWAARRRRALHAAWAGYDAPPWRLTRLDLVVRAGDRTERTIAVYPNDRASTWSGSVTAGLDASLIFDPPLPPGQYQLEIVAQLEDDRHRIESRRAALGPIQLAPSSAAPPPSAPSAPAPAPAAAADLPPKVLASRGCACALPGATGAGAGRAAIAIAAAGLFWARRRRRRSTRTIERLSIS